MYLNVDEYICLCVGTHKHSMRHKHKRKHTSIHKQPHARNKTVDSKMPIMLANIIQRICDKKKLCKFVINFYSDTKQKPWPTICHIEPAIGCIASKEQQHFSQTISLPNIRNKPVRFIHKCVLHKLSYLVSLNALKIQIQESRTHSAGNENTQFMQ